jgi:hypothetical protein
MKYAVGCHLLVPQDKLPAIFVAKLESTAIVVMGGGDTRISSAKLIPESLNSIKTHRANVEGLMVNIRSMISERTCGDIGTSLAKIQQEKVRKSSFLTDDEDWLIL